MCGYANPQCMHMVMGWGCTCNVGKVRKSREEKTEQRIQKLEKEIEILKAQIGK